MEPRNNFSNMTLNQSIQGSGVLGYRVLGLIV